MGVTDESGRRGETVGGSPESKSSKTSEESEPLVVFSGESSVDAFATSPTVLASHPGEYSVLKTSAPSRRNSSLAARRESSVTSGEVVIVTGVVLVVSMDVVNVAVVASGDTVVFDRVFRADATVGVDKSDSAGDGLSGSCPF